MFKIFQINFNGNAPRLPYVQNDFVKFQNLLPELNFFFNLYFLKMTLNEIRKFDLFPE